MKRIEEIEANVQAVKNDSLPVYTAIGFDDLAYLLDALKIATEALAFYALTKNWAGQVTASPGPIATDFEGNRARYALGTIRKLGE